jgi:hypothetical protein
LPGTLAGLFDLAQDPQQLLDPAGDRFGYATRQPSANSFAYALQPVFFFAAHGSRRLDGQTRRVGVSFQERCLEAGIVGQRGATVTEC